MYCTLFPSIVSKYDHCKDLSILVSERRDKLRLLFEGRVIQRRSLGIADNRLGGTAASSMSTE